MDPQSVAFQPQPQNDIWRVQNELQRVQAVQAEHSERLLRIERKQDDDARMKSVWGGASPFPGVLSGTPQQTPLQHPDAFKNFDDESANLIGSLHLDPEDEPRRVGATSRANSVRFDESANQGWAHTSRSSMDLIRSGGGLPMSERTSSHKSDGRASSVHSIRSGASGRANSLNLDTGFSFGDSARSPVDTPGLAPGLFLLGSVPAIIRCWMNHTFRHDALLYAAVCTGSHRSFLDRRLVDKLGYTSRINIATSGQQTVVLPVYLPEAVPHPTSSRSGSPAPQLPTLTVTFTVVPTPSSEIAEAKGIQIILGSDTLRVHNADVLFSSNNLSLFDDDRNKISIPLVRPEDERTFNVLRTTASEGISSPTQIRLSEADRGSTAINGLGQNTQPSDEHIPALATGAPIGTPRSVLTGVPRPPSANAGATDSSDEEERPTTGRSIRFAQLPPDTSSGSDVAAQNKDEAVARAGSARTASSPAMWGNWRQRGPESTQATVSTMDYANASKALKEATPKKESGIKVLRPMKSASRTFSATSTSSGTNSDGKSRFFDDGKRRSTMESMSGDRREGTPPIESLPPPGSSPADTTASQLKKRKTTAKDSSEDTRSGSGHPPAALLYAPQVNDPDRQPSPTPGSSSPFPLTNTSPGTSPSSPLGHSDSLPPLDPLLGSSRFLESIEQAANSPSDAYAALTLGSSGISESMSGSHNGDGNNASTTEVKGAAQDRFGENSLGRRSASPAKRSAAAMEGHEEDTVGVQDGIKSPIDTAMGDAGDTLEQTQDAGGSAPDDTTAVIDERVSKIAGLMQTELAAEEPGYLVSYKWLGRVTSRSTEMQTQLDFAADAREGPIGPVDNKDIVPLDGFEGPHLKFDKTEDAFVPLRPQLERTAHFEVLPKAAWDSIVEWYGLAAGQLPIIRYAKNTAPDGASQQNIQYELYPPIFTIRKMLSVNEKSARPLSPPATNSSSRANTGQATPEHDNQAVQIVASRQDRFQRFLTRSKMAAGIPMEHKVRPWRISAAKAESTSGPVAPSRPGMPTPAASRTGSPVPAEPASEIAFPPLTIERADFDKLQDDDDFVIIEADDNTANPKYNGRVTLETLGLFEDQTLILEEQVRGPAGGEFVSDAKRKQQKAELAKAAKADEPDTYNGPQTRGRAVVKGGRPRGVIGLQNLGNTCYMNSALQCVSRIEELAWYFLTPQWKKEINVDNPLGYHGSMARAFADFLSGLHMEGAKGSYSPRPFKGALSHAQPMFSGYGQQDSQEFLSFLVDALHEDLNRIHKKPYLENPDSDDVRVHDPEYIKELGEQYRSNHRARNDSIAMDLFSGFYKNTMVCPTCDKISVTFDPFSLLTVQLPIESTWQHKVFYIPNKGQPSMLLVDLDKNASIRTLKQRLADKVGARAETLFVGEFFNNNLYKVWKDGEQVSDITGTDVIAVFEFEHAPTNITKSKPAQYRSFTSPRDDDIPDMDSPMGDYMAVTVLNRHERKTSNLGALNQPLVVMITREEAKDFDLIFKKIIAQVAKYTSRNILADGAAQTLPTKQDTSRRSSDSGLTSGMDSPEPLDAKLSDRSVPSEDEYVNVSMRDGSSPAAVDSDLPEVLRPGTVIPTSIRSLFEVSYFSTTNGDINCTGTHGTLDTAAMFDRVRSVHSRRGSVASVNSTGTGTTEVSTTSVRSQTSSNARDDDEAISISNGNASNHFAGDVQSDEDLPNFVQPSDIVEDRFKTANRQKIDRKRGRGGKPLKTYTRKNRGHRQKNSPGQARNKQVYQSITPASNTKDRPEDDAYYIRLGEGIVLDWTEEGWDALFGGSPRSPEDERGYLLINDQVMKPADDPELEAKLEKRRRRKKEGVSLDDCFAETAKTETLSEENAWYCNRCKELRRADKTLMIWTAPDILVVHLKRFSGERFRRDKVDVLVDFPLEGLDLTHRVGLKEEGREYIYDLFAVDNHYGGLGGGHYTAYAKNFFDGKWYDFNDSSVSGTSPTSAITPAAYLLFYRRRSPTPLGPPYLRDLVTAARARAADLGDDSLDDSSAPQDSSSVSGVKSGNGRTLGTATTTRLLLPGAGNATTKGEDEGVDVHTDTKVEYDATPAEGAPIGTCNGAALAGPVRPSEGLAQGTDWGFEGLDQGEEGMDRDEELGSDGVFAPGGGEGGFELGDGDDEGFVLGQEDEGDTMDEVRESTEE
ncbi:hypothetical protein CAC42_7411 [Sphaceloma murrayae]|uniref:ubiquitinyl hydrolase 1 n=1 Tax=Sphaceloma murrayae TaxID=2082308 RepID=A0A2K1QWZ4_9PEZI|nr:hypothetical protein CAC42_7411 [Sphaceloma murrayae]